jgi:hypothetical protein
MNKIRKYGLMLLSGMMLSSTLVVGTSCSDDDDLSSSSSTNWNVSGNEIISIAPERYKLLRLYEYDDEGNKIPIEYNTELGGGGPVLDNQGNPVYKTKLLNPMQGWVVYGGLGDGLIDDLEEQYSNFETAEGQDNVFMYGGTMYVRGAWSDFEYDEGKYIWDEDADTITAKRFRMMRDIAQKYGMKLAFTFVTDSRDKHYNFTPEYVRAAGAKTFDVTTGSWHGWSPYPDDPIFQEKYEKFLTAFAQEFNDPDVTQFVSGFGLGKWGETHSLIYSTGDDSPRQAVTDWISSLMARLFTRVPIVINYHRCIMWTGEKDGADLDVAERLIDECVNKGFSLRHDAFGMKQYYQNWERGIASKYRYIRPIIMEGGWVEASHGGSISGDGYANFAEVRQGEYDEAKGANVNMMDLRYSSNVNSGETHSWFNTAFDLVKDFIAEGAYRLYPDKVSVPTTASAGGKVTLVHRWLNLGWGYCPTNLPQWNQKYKVCFALLDKNTGEPLYRFVDPVPELSDWVKGTPHSYSTSFTLDGVAAGEYTWGVGLVDTTNNNEIGIIISARDEFQTKDGWVKIADVTVN